MANESGSLMWSLQCAVRSGLPAQLMIGGSGTVSVYPRQQCYVSDILDWEAVYAASLPQIRVAPASWEVPPPGALPLEELQWRAAFHGAACEMAPQAQLPRGLVQLVSWPNVTRLPEELIEPVTRICALLWRKPTVGFLIPRVLELPPERAAAIVRVLQMLGHAHAPGTAEGAAPLPAEDALPRMQPREAQQQPASVVARLWKRLMRQGS